jgi:peptidoglycan-associated lipoprotein
MIYLFKKPNAGGMCLFFLLLIIILGSCSESRYYKSAVRTFDIGEYYKSIEDCRAAYNKTKDKKQKAELQFRIAEAYYRIGVYRLAESYYKSALIKNAGGNLIYLHYAEVLRANGKYAEALTNYNLYLTQVPNDERALNGIESCKAAEEWIKNPSRYKITNLKEINSTYSDFAAAYPGVRDNEIYFTSSRKGVTGKKKNRITGEYYTDIFRVTFNLQKNRWDKPQLVDLTQQINTFDEDGAASFTSDGTVMYFTRCRYDKDQEKGAEVYSSTLLSGIWSRPELVQIGKDSLMIAHPSVSKDGKTIYFVSDRPGGIGNKDIWMAEKTASGTWGKAVNLGKEINTPGDEMFPYIRENGELYFSSNSHPGLGGLDIFKAVKDKEGKWKVENMKSPVNSTGDDFSISFYPGEERGLFSSNREGSKGDDIYSFSLPPKIYSVEGDIYNKENGTKIDGASVRLIGTDGTMLKLKSENGKFRFKLKPDVDYVLAAYKKGYLNAKSVASTMGLNEGKEFQLRFDLVPVDKPISIDNIYYEFGKWDLMPESRNSLDSLAELLKLNPTIAIELMSHTDCVGDDASNSALSQKRAQSVVYYLISRGIQPGRLVAKGYGETAPKTVTKNLAQKYPFLKQGQELSCGFIESLKDKDQQEVCHQINRRTEFKVISSDYKEKFTK